MKARPWLAWAGAFAAGLVLGGGGVYWGLRPAEQPAGAAGPGLERRWEATIYLPAPGEGEPPITEAEWQAALGLLLDEFNGATLQLPLEGCWLHSSGKLQREQVRPVVISFEPRRLARFRGLLDEVGRRLRQESIYVRYEQPLVELRSVPP